MSGNKAVADHRRQIRNLNALLEVAKVMGKEIQLDSLLHIIVHKTTEVMEAERSSLLLYDEEKDELWSKVAEGIEVKEIRFPAHTGIAGDVIKTRQVANIPDAYHDPRFNPDVDKHSGFKTKAVLCMPIITSQGKLLGALQVLNKVSGDTFNREDESLLEALVAQVAVALDRAQLVEAFLEKKRIEEALKLAHDIQMGLLPKTFPPFPDKPQIDLHASILPAKGVCGDFYDFFFVDEDHLCFVIADVSGKGIPAAFFMAVTQTLIKIRSARESPPCQTLMKVNNDLYQQNETGMFVTIFYGMLNIRTGELTYSNGGHNPPYILRQKQG
ncbi:MAG: SpoIIE family protein phosphatase, partial [Desulfatiglandaceae bacterium]